ncbi:energy transducer TonB [uncultured Helicobacter sp.]|uniref:energy transducer TonB n=1 Tax=uncultured Helicobacter sp. TaxID=175537 RepID=UPI0026189E79|nr:energy transducer TonB [uncultured Helicobacter sp.]
MVNKIFLFLTSGGIAVFSYILMITLLIWQFNVTQKPPKAYTTYKETTFSIDLIEEIQPKNITKIAQKKVEKKVENMPIKKESASKTANIGTGINELFKQIDSKMPIKKEALKPQSENDKIAKKKKAQESHQSEHLNSELEKIMANLDTQKTLNFVTPKGEYNEFYAKVQEILTQNWNPIRTSQEHKAEVQISINAFGKFSYSIIQLSGNLDFDKALQEFLDIMRTQEFPRFEGGEQTNIMVTFKTEV